MSFMDSLRVERAQSMAVSDDNTAYTQRLIRNFQTVSIANNVRDAVLEEVVSVFKTKGYVDSIEVHWSHSLTKVRQDSVPGADKKTLDHFINSQVERGWEMALHKIAESYGRKNKKTLLTTKPHIQCGYEEHESEKLDQSGNKPRYIPYVQPYADVGIWCTFALTLK